MSNRKNPYILRFYVSAGIALFICVCFLINEIPRFSKLLLIVALIIDGSVLVIADSKLDRK